MKDFAEFLKEAPDNTVMAVKRDGEDVYRRPILKTPPRRPLELARPTPKPAPIERPLRDLEDDPGSPPAPADGNYMGAQAIDAEMQDEFERRRLIRRHGLEDVVGTNDFLKGKLGNVDFVRNMANPRFRDYMSEIDRLRSARPTQYKRNNYARRPDGTWGPTKQEIDTLTDWEKYDLDNEDSFNTFQNAIAKIVGMDIDDVSSDKTDTRNIQTRNHYRNEPEINQSDTGQAKGYSDIENILQYLSPEQILNTSENRLRNDNHLRMMRKLYEEGFTEEDLTSLLNYGAGTEELLGLDHKINPDNHQAYDHTDMFDDDDLSQDIRPKTSKMMARRINILKALRSARSGELGENMQSIADILELTKDNDNFDVKDLPKLDNFAAEQNAHVTSKIRQWADENNVEYTPNWSAIPYNIRSKIRADSSSQFKSLMALAGARMSSSMRSVDLTNKEEGENLQKILAMREYGGAEPAENRELSGGLVLPYASTMADAQSLSTLALNAMANDDEVASGILDSLSYNDDVNEMIENFRRNAGAGSTDRSILKKLLKDNRGIVHIGDILREGEPLTHIRDRIYGSLPSHLDENSFWSETEQENYELMEDPDDLYSMMADAIDDSDFSNTLADGGMLGRFYNNLERALEDHYTDQEDLERERAEEQENEDGDGDYGFSRELLNQRPRDINRLDRMRMDLLDRVSGFARQQYDAGRFNNLSPEKQQRGVQAVSNADAKRRRIAGPQGDADTRTGYDNRGARGDFTHFTADVYPNPNQYGIHRIPTLDADLKKAGLTRDDLHSAAYIAWSARGNTQLASEKYKEKYGGEPNTSDVKFINFAKRLAALDAVKTWKQKILPNLTPGTVVYNTPVGGGAGGDMRANLYGKFGFGKNSSIGQHAVVGKDGKLYPLNPHSPASLGRNDERRRNARRQRRG